MPVVSVTRWRGDGKPEPSRWAARKDHVMRWVRDYVTYSRHADSRRVSGDVIWIGGMMMMMMMMTGQSESKGQRAHSVKLLGDAACIAAAVGPWKRSRPPPIHWPEGVNSMGEAWFRKGSEEVWCGNASHA